MNELYLLIDCHNQSAEFEGNNSLVQELIHNLLEAKGDNIWFDVAWLSILTFNQ
jgi:hypothetical protein